MRGVRDDGAIGRDELDYEFGLTTRGVGQNKTQIASVRRSTAARHRSAARLFLAWQIAASRGSY